MRAGMGEDLLKTLNAAERKPWAARLNSFARPDGPGDPASGGHPTQRANGMVIGALRILGGKRLRPVSLYDAVDTPAKANP